MNKHEKAKIVETVRFITLLECVSWKERVRPCSEEACPRIRSRMYTVCTGSITSLTRIVRMP